MNDNKFYKIGAAVLVLLITIIVMFIVLANKKDNKIAESQEEFPSVMSSSNIVENGEVSSEVNQFQEIATSENNTSKTADTNKTSDKKTTENKATENKAKENTSKASSKKNTITENKTANKTTKNEEKQNVNPIFCYPVEGEVIMEYAKDKLVYSNTLGEWITHLGIDIKANKTTVVKASADGTVKSIKTDPRYGLTVVIVHTNGFSTVYSNLLTAEFVKEGEKVRSGQTIGTIGNTASFEILDESHLHFEILKDNEQIDPNMYLKK
ncbi:MAG: peptidoglycan DD-metalloendopeptidase family protein [Clostridia bacterium]|nr:peptidoglycan DD-metalloendopeptidase family protein [Clostridia bacterium]